MPRFAGADERKAGTPKPTRAAVSGPVLSGTIRP